MKFRRADGIAIAFFLLLVGIFFRQTILGGKLPVPSDALVGLYHPWRDQFAKDYPRGVPFKNFLITDPVRQQIPWRKIAIDQWKEGRLPLWNPYNFSGAPLLANIQAAALYPLNALFFLFSFADAWTILIVLQPVLAGFFMYWYLRSLILRVEASLLGAIAWSFSGFSIAWFTWGTIGHVALWLPLALMAVDKMPRNVIWAFILVVSLVFQFFAGHVQMSLYFVLIVLAYTAMRPGNKLLLVCVFGISALLTAMQWMPFFEWTAQSSRVIEASDWTKEGWFLPWQHLAQFVVPDFFGNPTTLNYWGQWNYGEFVGYIGVAPLLFALTGVFSPNIKSYWFWVGALVIALLFALPTPIAYLPFILKIPLLSSLQPTRLMFVIDFALAVLAAHGFHALLEERKKARSSTGVMFVALTLSILWSVATVMRLEVSVRNLVLPTAFFAVSAILFFLYHAAHARIVAWGFMTLAAVDLLRFGWKFTPFTPHDYFFPETNVISFLKQQKEPLRVMSVDKRMLPPNTASFFGIESVEGYDPIYSSGYEELMAAIARGRPDIAPPFGFNRIVSLESVDSPLVPLLGAKFVLSLTPLQEPFLTKVFEEGETIVYEDARALPRVWAVEGILRASDKKQAIEALYAIKDYRSEAVVEEDMPLLSMPMKSDETVTLTGYTSDRLNIDATLAVPRLIVIANAYHPKWQAWVDGSKTAIVRTNYAFQGVVVPQGRHRVTLIYGL